MSEPPNRDAKPNPNATMQIDLDQLDGLYDPTPEPPPTGLAPTHADGGAAHASRKTPPPLPPVPSVAPAPPASSGGGSLRTVVFGVLFVALLAGAIAAGVTVGGTMRGGGAAASASGSAVVVSKPGPAPAPAPAPAESVMTLPTIEVKAE